MATIKAYISMDERRGVHYYRYFKIIDSLPKVGDEYELDTVSEVYEVPIDCEQGNDEVYEYDYYNIVVKDEEGEEYNNYVAIKKEEDEIAMQEDLAL